MYTKGTWIADFGDDGAVVYCEHGTIAEIPIDMAGYEANANLIAAAPDMYEALKELYSQCDADLKPSMVTMEKVFKALNKAEGIGHD